MVIFENECYCVCFVILDLKLCCCRMVGEGGDERVVVVVVDEGRVELR